MKVKVCESCGNPVQETHFCGNIIAKAPTPLERQMAEALNRANQWLTQYREVLVVTVGASVSDPGIQKIDALIGRNLEALAAFNNTYPVTEE